jgi:two-component system chemotaxis response regulator CheB
MPEPGEKIRVAAMGRLARCYARPSKTAQAIFAIGASTGGTEALRDLLAALPADCPGTVIVQHMPEHFTKAFARRCNDHSALEVREAQDGDLVKPGRALIAPGNRHMRVVRLGAEYMVRIEQSEPVNHHRPSVDVLFQSVAEAAGRSAVGALLTGMGDDGARGLLKMKIAGAHTIAQDRASCVVFGMPREAIELGAACQVLPLSEIAAAALARFV